MHQPAFTKFVKFLKAIRLGWVIPFILLIKGEDRPAQVKAIVKGTAIPLAAIGLFLVVWDVSSKRIVTKFGTVPGPSQVWSAWGSLLNERRLETIKEADHLRRQRAKRLAQLEKYAGVLEVMPGKAFELASPETKVQAMKALDDRMALINAMLDLPTRLGEATDAQVAQDLVESLPQERSQALAETIAGTLVPLEIQFREAQAALNAVPETGDNRSERAHQTRQLEHQKAQLLMARQRMTTMVTKGALDQLNSIPSGQRKELNNLDRSFATLGIRLKTWHQQVEAEEAASGKKFKDRTKLKLMAKTFDTKPYPGKDTYLQQIATSLKTVFFGFLVASLIAIPIGILCGLNPTVNHAINPLIQIFKPVSPLAWLPIVMIVVGALYVSDDPMFEISFVNSAITVALCSLWPTLVNTAVGVASTDKDFLNVARVLKLSWFKKIWKVVLPSSLPLVFTGLRLSLGVGWMVLIAAEMLAQNPGLGKFVWDMFQNGSSETLSMIMVAVFTIGIIGFLLDTIMLSLQKMVSFGEAI